MTTPNQSASRWFVSAASRSSGKTTVAIGLCAALARRGNTVQSFKKGPDFIDPMWLGLASGRPCRNLDPHIAGWRSVDADFARFAGDGVSLVEGNHGLFDGFADDGSDSNAALARRLDLPVVLVVDTRGTSRGIAPLLLGYRSFDPAIRFAGVILNRVSGSRHESRLRESIATHTDFRVLGAMPEDEAVSIRERHLGLMPANERRDASELVDRLARQATLAVDLDTLLAITRCGTNAAPVTPGRSPHGERAGEQSPAPGLRAARPDGMEAHSGVRRSTRVSGPVQAPDPDRQGRQVAPAHLRIGIARDRAFGFYYPGDIEALEAAGAELVPIDTIADRALPAIDGLLIGGGFPEELATELAANAPLRGAIRQALEAGLPCHAECGGLMYLARSIRRGRRRYEMVGALPFDVAMSARPVGRGYVRLRETDAFPWARPAKDPVLAHEFHHSRPENLPRDLRYAYLVERGHGVDGRHDGVVIGNLLATYAHLRDVPGRCDWVMRFLAFVGHHSGRSRPESHSATSAG